MFLSFVLRAERKPVQSRLDVPSHSLRGFTPLELLIVIAIIAVLISHQLDLEDRHHFHWPVSGWRGVWNADDANTRRRGRADPLPTVMDRERRQSD